MGVRRQARTSLMAERFLRRRLGLTVVLVSHDVGVVRVACDRVAVMHAGTIVEDGETEQVFNAPAHPYTRQLLQAAPRFDLEC